MDPNLYPGVQGVAQPGLYNFFLLVPCSEEGGQRYLRFQPLSTCPISVQTGQMICSQSSGRYTQTLNCVGVTHASPVVQENTESVISDDSKDSGVLPSLSLSTSSSSQPTFFRPWESTYVARREEIEKAANFSPLPYSPDAWDPIVTLEEESFGERTFYSSELSREENVVESSEKNCPEIKREDSNDAPSKSHRSNGNVWKKVTTDAIQVPCSVALDKIPFDEDDFPALVSRMKI